MVFFFFSLGLLVCFVFKVGEQQEAFLIRLLRGIFLSKQEFRLLLVLAGLRVVVGHEVKDAPLHQVFECPHFRKQAKVCQEFFQLQKGQGLSLVIRIHSHHT